MWALPLAHTWFYDYICVLCVCACVCLCHTLWLVRACSPMPACEREHGCVARISYAYVCVCVWVLGSFDAFLSGLARFALFVFNDASREADSRRVERTAFDVSDYDITDVQSRRAEEWGSVLSVFFFFFNFPVAYYSERKREGETETRGERRRD